MAPWRTPSASPTCTATSKRSGARSPTGCRCAGTSPGRCWTTSSGPTGTPSGSAWCSWTTAPSGASPSGARPGTATWLRPTRSRPWSSGSGGLGLALGGAPGVGDRGVAVAAVGADLVGQRGRGQAFPGLQRGQDQRVGPVVEVGHGGVDAVGDRGVGVQRVAAALGLDRGPAVTGLADVDRVVGP